MSWADVFGALATGAGAGLSAYGQYKTEEQERREREAERAADRAFQREQLQLQRENYANQLAAQMAGLGFTQADEEQIRGAEIAPQAPNLLRLRETLAPTPMDVVPPPQVGEGGRMMGGAMVAPEDTMAARRTRTPVETALVEEAGAAPEAVRAPSARERGVDIFRMGGTAYQRPSEQLEFDRRLREAEFETRMRTEAERELIGARAQAELETGRELAIFESQQEAAAESALVNMRRNLLIAAGIPEADATQMAITRSYAPGSRTDKSPIELFRGMMSDFLTERNTATGSLPSPEEIVRMTQLMGKLYGLTDDEIDSFLTVRPQGPPAPPGPQDQVAVDPIIAREQARRAAEERRSTEVANARQMYDRLIEALRSGIYNGQPVTPAMNLDIQRELMNLNRRYNFSPSRGGLIGG